MKRLLTLVAVFGAAVGLFSLGSTAKAAPWPQSRTIVVTADDLADCGPSPAAPTCRDAHRGRSWFFYNDVNDTINNSLGSFVYCQYGPCPLYDGAGANPPLGAGSVEISTVLNRRPNLATYQFGGVKLADIKTLEFSTYNPSAGNGQGPSASAYLHFNVDFIGNSTAWQRRMVFVLSSNGPIVPNTWKAWDAIDGAVPNSQGGVWIYSGGTWPAGALPACAAAGSKTWAQVLACYPQARILPGDSFLGLRIGEPYPNGYTENIDAFKFGTAQYTLTFDFEPRADNGFGGRHDSHHGHDDD